MNTEQMRKILQDLADDAEAEGWRRGAMGLIPDLKTLVDRAEAALSAKSVSDETVKRMVDAFLGWPLPDDFAPDCGISFTKINEGTEIEHQYNPIGTNLFTTDQAKAMVEYMLSAAPKPPQPPQSIEATPEGYISHDAYRGAMEDKQEWKNRALKAEKTLENMCRAFNEENGPTHMGEPVIAAQSIEADKVQCHYEYPVVDPTEESDAGVWPVLVPDGFKIVPATEADNVRELEKDSQPKLEVVIRSFPESNGKRNWTALLVRLDKSWDGLIGNCGGITIERGELWNRVAYEAERTKSLLGQRKTEPCILDYGDDIKTPEEWSGEAIDQAMKGE